MATLLTAACSDGESIGNGVGPEGVGSMPTTGATGTDLGMPTGPVATDPVTGMPLPTGTGQPSTTGTTTGALPTGAGTTTTTPTGTTTTPSGTTAEASTCVPGVPVTSQIARLTNTQYNRTVFDLVGATSAGLLATEQAGNISDAIWGGYQSSADTIAAQVMADESLKSKFMKCTPSGDGSECLKATIQEFGRRAYRRPLTTEETADFESLVTRGAELTPTGSVDEVAELILSTFLKMPTFLQRAEVSSDGAPDASGNYALSSHEVAARLSYMIWGTTPDDELSKAADDDALQTKDQVLAQATRMVSDPKARDVAAEFHRTYLKLSYGSRWDSAQKDPNLFPLFLEDVVPDMIAETEMLFDDVYTSDGTFSDLLTTNNAFITAKTAPLYGLDAADFGATPTKHVFTAADNRPGFLTRIGFLAAWSAQTRTSPILRGSFITKYVIGVDPGAPDPNAVNAKLPTDPQYDTNRKRVEAQTSGAACTGCHTPFINPPGFVMEAFDAAGMAQTTEKDTGAAIDTTGAVKFSVAGDPVQVNNPTELAIALAASKEAQRFYAARWVGYAFERQLTGPDQCTVDTLAASASAGSYPIKQLLTDLTQSDTFLVRALEVTQ